MPAGSGSGIVASARPVSSVGAWVGVAVAAAFVLLLACTLAVICYPPLVTKLPPPLRTLLGPAARFGEGRGSRGRYGDVKLAADLAEHGAPEEDGEAASSPRTNGGRVALE